MFDRYRDNCKRLGQNSRRFLINFKIKFNLFPFGKYIGVQSGSANYSIDRSIDSRNSFFLDCVVPNRYYTCKSGPRGLPPMGFTWAEHARSDLQIIRTTGILLPSFPLPPPCFTYTMHPSPFSRSSPNTTVRALTYTRIVVAGRTNNIDCSGQSETTSSSAYLVISQRSDNLRLLIDSCD